MIVFQGNCSRKLPGNSGGNRNKLISEDSVVNWSLLFERISCSNLRPKAGVKFMRGCALCTLGKIYSVNERGVTLTLKEIGKVPVEVDGILPETVLSLGAKEIGQLKVQIGKQTVELGDIFDIKCHGDEVLIFEGDLKSVKRIGENMSQGRIMVKGDAGMHLGQRMKGGTIVVNGNLEPRCCCEMSGGTVVVKGNAKAMLGSPLPGNSKGMRGGMIMVFGSVGNRVGEGMRRGLIAVTGDAGDFAGANMIAGTIVVFGKMGLNAGGGMKRGSIVSIGGTDRVLSTFGYSCLYSPTYLKLYFKYLWDKGFPITDEIFNGLYRRYVGDMSSLGKGEILILENS
ncbi:formylmethanofuran dehydrogenase, subunit C [Acetomicrobium thermoterrenum DSM 13490]|jgi:formylmethanofuran dehydrogenase subunit C|uniref:Formylmethanofuran dehydrogenase, subunit C n=2 Tax=Acetomicrobium TaxID=49894 RepID=A0A1H3H0A2_9BACT|nr:formylmethanofuran dehydrogenase, subunit C [Acetomicrobium thermoterrenum DSM 13490]